MFLPIAFVHPIRVERLRVLSVGMLGVWAVAATVAIIQKLEPGFAVKAVLFICVIYFAGLGLLRGKLTEADRA
jgi:phosphatidylcholine synthase